jgi:hypothetical protein
MQPHVNEQMSGLLPPLSMPSYADPPFDLDVVATGLLGGSLIEASLSFHAWGTSVAFGVFQLDG